MKLIKIRNGFFINPEHIVAIRTLSATPGEMLFEVILVDKVSVEIDEKLFHILVDYCQDVEFLSKLKM